MVDPWFEPGSGWHKTAPFSAPGSSADNEAYALSAWRGWVILLRHEGHRVPARELVLVTPRHAGVNATSIGPSWTLQLSELPDLTNRRGVLYGAQLTRMNAGVRLYHGWQWKDGAQIRHEQALLCAPTEAALRAVLEKMAAQEAQSPGAVQATRAASN